MNRPDPARIRAITRVADRQSGLITAGQLARLGVDRFAARRLVRGGWLRSVHRGVYLVGHGAPAPWQRETAVLLTYGTDAALVAETSLRLSEMRPADDGAPIDAAVPGQNRRVLQGVRYHRFAEIDPRDIGTRHGLPVTRPARALLESVATLGTRATERALDEGLALGRLTRPDVLATIDRYPGHRGARRLRELADPGRASEITDSEAEARLAMLLRRAGAPPSRTGYPIGPYRADRCWPELRLVIEVDGVQYHRDGKRMEADNRRADQLRRWGWTVIRFTRRQLVHDPEYVLLRIGEELGRGQLTATTAAALS